MAKANHSNVGNTSNIIPGEPLPLNVVERATYLDLGGRHAEAAELCIEELLRRDEASKSQS